MTEVDCREINDEFNHLVQHLLAY